MFKLERIDKKYVDSIKRYKEEMINANSSMDGCSMLQDFEDIEEWINYNISLEKRETMPEGCKLIPAIEYLLIDDNDEVVGMFNLRLELNDFLFKVGGHIGYSIIPSQRRKGYAKKGLQLTLKVCLERGIDNVLVTCLKENEGSKRTILANGGIIDNEIQYDNKTYLRFWIPTRMYANEHEYIIEKFLGRGKGGYSYLARRDNQEFTLKKIHHEPCSYYTFGNKIEAEKTDYNRIKATGIRIPKLVEIDEKNEIIIKEYIEGDQIMDLLQKGIDVSIYYPQIIEMAKMCYKKNLNIDYYPTNFIVKDGLLFYIDYECNVYSDEWNLENWGLGTWKK